jgi:hypothetical protein
LFSTVRYRDDRSRTGFRTFWDLGQLWWNRFALAGPKIDWVHMIMR